MRLLLPLFIIVQELLSIGFVIGFSFLMPELDRHTSIYHGA
ncbi:hypothetical protein SH601_06155 [Gracilibacillus sp. S3-1-1]|uniref:Uncharacterized protein n=1 Tax=Gracilibacillus pellucidus TaxID=3095368 RepID=A0ACC6M3P5_9BACI|nr:hypothetical protein [Gracilibacillus sp. S3-1-1]MDX8045566.1 hypothetical protein [Gracilibacillus sp. S3-1-1]